MADRDVMPRSEGLKLLNTQVNEHEVMDQNGKEEGLLEGGKASLFAGIEAMTERYFGRSIRHRTLLLEHRERPPSRAAGLELTHAIHLRVRANFVEVIASGGLRPSLQNWRLVSPRRLDCDDINKPREVGLERALVDACWSRHRTDWWNQVPVASGLINSTAGKKRAIDLVHRRGEAAFDFVELKIDSDTPLYAAVEIMQYGFLWLLSREKRTAIGATRASLLDANDVALSVLAPASFYRQVEYSDFGEGIDAALKQIAMDLGVTLSFGFKRFPDVFEWDGAADSATLCHMLDALYPTSK